MALSKIGVDTMSEQYFTRPNVQPVITNIGTTPEQRQMSTSEFKAKFDEMPEAIQQYIKETLLVELDAFKEEFMTHQADMTPQIISSSFTRVVGDSGTIYARYIPFLNLVWLSFNITGISEDTSSSTTIITFDTKYAPVTTIRGVVRSPSASGGTGQISIGSGSINVTMDSNQNTLRGVYTWFTA